MAKEKKKKEKPKRGTIEKMKILKPEEYAELRLQRALEIECMDGTLSVSRIVDLEKQEAIGFLFVDNDGVNYAVVKENAWKQ